MKTGCLAVIGFVTAVLCGCGHPSQPADPPPGQLTTGQYAETLDNETARSLVDLLDRYGTAQWRANTGGGQVWLTSGDRDAAQNQARAEMASLLEDIKECRLSNKWTVMSNVALCRLDRSTMSTSQRAAWTVMAKTNRQALARTLRSLENSQHPEKQALLHLARDLEPTAQ